jgi:thiol-disulfide isomerase/thioredoxin
MIMHAGLPRNIAVALVGGALAACGGGSIKAGTYRVALQLPGGELPFGLDLEREGPNWVAYVLNDPERLKVSEVTVKNSHLEIRMPGFENRLTADATAGGLKGEVIVSKAGAKEQHIPLRAAYNQTYRFFPPNAGPAQPPAAGPDVSGRWSVTFADEAGATEIAIGEFSQQRDLVTGTILTDNGDHRYLAGQVRGDEFYLSTFDGAHAFLYKAKIVAPEGTLAGDFWSGTAYHERFTGKRDPKAALPDAYTVTNMRPGVKKFDFAFPDLAGNTVASSDPKFKDKVLIIALAGSWCPNCHDEAAFLEPLYRDYREKGLEVVSLMFEHFGDFERAVAATERFRRHYGIEYTTLIAGISDKDDASKKLPMLDRVYAFPTMIVVDRSGEVRKIHTGFTGPATGEHYTDFVAEFKHSLDQLLAEKS